MAARMHAPVAAVVVLSGRIAPPVVEAQDVLADPREARDLGAMLAFVDALRSDPQTRLAQVVLISHQVRQNDPQRPITFEISAQWSA